jgi:hypothetical protein
MSTMKSQQKVKLGIGNKGVTVVVIQPGSVSQVKPLYNFAIRLLLILSLYHQYFVSVQLLKV